MNTKKQWYLSYEKISSKIKWLITLLELMEIRKNIIQVPLNRKLDEYGNIF